MCSLTSGVWLGGKGRGGPTDRTLMIESLPGGSSTPNISRGNRPLTNAHRPSNAREQLGQELTVQSTGLSQRANIIRGQKKKK